MMESESEFLASTAAATKAVVDLVDDNDQASSEEEFLNQFNGARQAVVDNLKENPWARLFPLQDITVAHFDAVPSSTPPQHLITIGKMLIHHIKEWAVLGKKTNEEPTPEALQFLNSFDDVFQQILAAPFEKKKDLDDFLDMVWFEHVDNGGLIKFNKVIKETLLRSSYRHLEGILEEAIKTANPFHLHDTAKMNSYNFQIFIHILHQLYEVHHQSPGILNFTRDFIQTFPNSYKFEGICFFPTPFHPILLLSGSCASHPEFKTEYEILRQILEYADTLYKNHPEVHPFISFVLKANETAFNLLRQAKISGMLSYRLTPYLWDSHLLKFRMNSH